MGILAIVFLVAYFIWKCIHDSQEGWRAGGQAMEARAKSQRWYYTYQGTFRVSDNRKVHVAYDPETCSCIETDLKTFQKTNLSEQVRRTLERTARENGFPTAVKADDFTNFGEDRKKMKSCHVKPGAEFWGPKASRYKDIATGKLYVIQHYAGAMYFRDTETWKLVRPTDDQISIELKAKENGRFYRNDNFFERNIAQFNEKQERMTDDAISMTGLYEERGVQLIWEWYDNAYYLPSIANTISPWLKEKGLIKNSFQMIDDAVSKRPLMEQKETQSNEED